ncbi:MAG: adenylosuccinate synthase [Clostridia bacterium]|nr:adenylosuccinate synthase [Clostridia bacterium]
MTSVVLIGAQWGDEGKGKMTDYLAAQADMVLRCMGGSNAGHTVVANGVTHKLHLIPSGILYPNVTCVIGNGVVVDLKVLLKEIENLHAQNLSTEHLLISEKAHLIMPYHYTMDEYQESLKGDQKIGTTKRGIGPAYMDKVARQGIRLLDLMDKEVFTAKLDYNIKEKNAIFTAAGLEIIDEAKRNEIIKEFMGYAEIFKKYMANTIYIANDAAAAGKKLLFEGAQGTLLDVDHGTYPFVTSSSPTAGGACTGSGVGPTMINRVLGIAKAYSTRVGEGPFPTELFDEVGENIRQSGFEFGTTTGRPRRCGWFDAVVVRYSTLVNGLTDLAVTKLDVLDNLKEIKFCRAYKINGQETNQFPSSLRELNLAKPVIETLPGWECDTTGCRSFEELPENAQKYLLRLEELCQVPISLVAIGPDREQTIVRKPLF